MRQTDALYSSFLKDSKKELKALFIARYIEVWLELKKKEPREDMLDELADMYLAGLLEEPNDVTHYVFETELIRKRDRAKEAILSVPTRTQKQLELDKAARIFAQMLGWYTDFASQDAEIQAMEDAGVEKVVRHELMDSRVCSVCRKANGEIYEMRRCKVKKAQKHGDVYKPKIKESEKTIKPERKRLCRTSTPRRFPVLRK